jgi:lambda repressor-like predicted transcriptional regulator
LVIWRFEPEMENAVRASHAVAAVRRAEMNTQVSQLFATCLCAFRECSDEIQAMIVEMASIANDPEATPEEREAAVATIAEALFPDGDGGTLGVDLEESESLDAQGPEKAALDALDAEETAFSERLAALLRDKQMTQVQLAESIGVGQPAISMMLSRKCRPQRRTVEKIAGALGVAPEELWPGFTHVETSG